MSNITISNIDNNSPILRNAQFQDGLLTVAGAKNILAGTILAVDSVSKKFVYFEKGGTTNENGIPKAILAYPVTATGAGDIPVRVGISGEYRKEKLVIEEDDDDSNIDQDVKDQLRDYSLIPVNAADRLNIYDNQ